MRKLLAFFFSTRLMAFLFISFATAMAIGTFIENDYNTDTARILVYNAWWFELIMLLFLINFLGNIPRYQLYKKEKWATLILHLSFILILVGAFITRYISFEGVMPIREGEAESRFYSDRVFLTAWVDGDHNGELKRRTFERPLILSPVTDNSFTLKGKFSDTPFRIEYVKYVMNAQESIKPSATGKLYFKLVESGEGQRHEHYLEEGTVANIHNVLFAFNKPTPGAININTDGDGYTISTPFEGQYMRMADQQQGAVAKDVVQPLMLRSLYTLSGAQFVFPEPAVKGVKGYVSNNDFKDKETDDLLVVRVVTDAGSKEVFLKGSKGMVSEPQAVKLGSLDFTLFFGSKVHELPFSLRLDDFIATKYPGTEKSYASYESRVTVMENGKQTPERIYMNNILDHRGYRFFQSSFHPDEKGTVLSVNHDFWGTNITYLGYYFLYFGLMAIMFTKHSRFGDLKRKLEAVKKKKAKMLAALLLLFSIPSMAQTGHEGHNHADGQHAKHQHVVPLARIDSFIQKTAIAPHHAERFGRLVIQDQGGRMKPVNTFSSELLRKVSKSDTYKGLNSDQVFLSMTQYRDAWFEVPLVFLKRGNDSIRKIIGIGKDDKYAPFISFFDEVGNYKLSPYLDEAYKAAVPNQFQKDFIEVDKRVNLLNSALSGSILRIFPIPGDANNKWVSYMELHQANLKGMDSVFTRQIVPVYMMALQGAVQKNDYKEADFYLDGITKYQKKHGAAVMPSADKIDSEIMYNKYDIFRNLYYMYMMAGVLMLMLTIVQIFYPGRVLAFAINAFHVVIGLFFALHTLGLIARWYISGHAPWSDAYESMIYVAWATMFFTLAFDRKSKLTIASGTFVTAMILMIAHWNWMDPAIANLQPVLNSYWLMIHVAVIVASYGPFTLGMVLGFVSLLLMIFKTRKNAAKMDLHIKEISYINEMALTIGLVMLTIGNFLGGQWANESWGRYWGWDPKETWALVSIMVYAFVIHARFVPMLRGKWIFSLMSVVAFYSILMTYFGVNFYLSGLHSYASGDKVVTPSFVYWSFAVVVFVAAVAFWRNRLVEKSKAV